MIKKTKEANYRLIHGWLSLALMTITGLIGFSGIIVHSKMFSMIFLAVIFTGCSMIVIGYCSKCSCRYKACGHIIFGPITRFLPKRKPGDYSVTDYVLTGVGGASIALYPQFWLMKNHTLLISFWITALFLCAEILVFICKRCPNNNCPASHGYKK